MEGIQADYRVPTVKPNEQSAQWPIRAFAQSYGSSSASPHLNFLDDRQWILTPWTLWNFVFIQIDWNFSPQTVPQSRLMMSGSRPHTCLGISSHPSLEASFDPENPRRISLDPSVIRAKRETNRAQTPVPGLEYSTVRKVKLKFDTRAKITNLIRRTLELETSAAVDEAHLSELLDVLLHTEVTLSCLV